MKSLICMAVFLVHNCSYNVHEFDDIEVDTDTDTDMVEHEGEVYNTEVFSKHKNVEYEDDEIDYPQGPYGYKPALREIDGEYVIDKADTLEDFCFVNHKREEVCISDYFFESERDILIIDFSFSACPPCNFLAEHERDFIHFLWSHRWDANYVTVLADSVATQDEAIEAAENWVSKHKSVGEVVVDYPSIFTSKMTSDKWPEVPGGMFPSILYVDLNNMKIIAEHLGFPFSYDPDEYKEEVEKFFHEQLEKLNYVRDNS